MTVYIDGAAIGTSFVYLMILMIFSNHCSTFDLALSLNLNSQRSFSPGIPAKTRVIERTKPMVKTKKSEQLLEDFRKKRKQASDSQTSVAGSLLEKLPDILDY